MHKIFFKCCTPCDLFGVKYEGTLMMYYRRWRGRSGVRNFLSCLSIRKATASSIPNTSLNCGFSSLFAGDKILGFQLLEANIRPKETQIQPSRKLKEGRKAVPRYRDRELGDVKCIHQQLTDPALFVQAALIAELRLWSDMSCAVQGVGYKRNIYIYINSPYWQLAPLKPAGQSQSCEDPSLHRPPLKQTP